MSDFLYTAWTKGGVKSQNVIEAANPRAVADILHTQGLVVSSIKPVNKKIELRSVFESLRPIKLLDKITFIKNLSVMTKAGLPISRCLRILSDQTTNPKFAKIIKDISHLVEGGTSLADSLAKYPNVFHPLFQNMVRVGEVSGSLDQSLSYLSEQMQRDYDLMSKARGALTYPIIIVIALAIVGFLMFTFVLPKLITTFTELNAQLPLMTRIVIYVVNIFQHYGVLILFCTILLISFFIYFRTTIPGKKIIHKMVLYTPIASGIVVKLNLARFMRVFSSLIKSGMPIVEALEVSSRVVGNYYYQQSIGAAAEKVKVGAALSGALRRQPRLFSNLVVQMIEVGEESGTTDAVLAEVANFYETEVDQDMKNLSSVLEPVIMIVIGVVVGFLAVALITPIYDISQSIN